jgi:3-hydroxy-9,10-secoandrosta-1,3,5(10)-triene-9,17-dione monooxygenase reductase component
MSTSQIHDHAVRNTSPPDPSAMRAVLGHFCTGVAVITGHDGSRPHGFACQSVTSVSLDPPYVSFCPAQTSSSWPKIRTTGRVCINVLASGQRAVCATFATSGVDKFADVPWGLGDNGSPVLHDALASIEADIELEHVAGDHTIVVARVTALHAYEGRHPLVYYRGGYGAFGTDE